MSRMWWGASVMSPFVSRKELRKNEHLKTKIPLDCYFWYHYLKVKEKDKYKR